MVQTYIFVYKYIIIKLLNKMYYTLSPSNFETMHTYIFCNY